MKEFFALPDRPAIGVQGFEGPGGQRVTDKGTTGENPGRVWNRSSGLNVDESEIEAVVCEHTLADPHGTASLQSPSVVTRSGTRRLSPAVTRAAPEPLEHCESSSTADPLTA